MSKQQFVGLHAELNIFLAIPHISKICAASFLERSFLYAAPTLWNKLRIDLRILELNQTLFKVF